MFILSLKTKSFLKTYHSTIFLTNGRTFQLFSADLSKMRMRGCRSVDTSLRPVFSEDFQTFLTILPVWNEAAKELSAQIVKRKVSVSSSSPSESEVWMAITQGTLELCKILAWDQNNDTV